MIGRVVIAVAGAIAVGVLAQAAGAFLTGSAAVTPTARAMALEAGPTPTVALRGRAATLTWAPTGFDDGTPAPGYAVARYPADDPTARVPAGGGCAGIVAGTACSEPGVPPGRWRYAVTPRAGSAWSGPEGPPSAAVVVAAPTARAEPTLIGAEPRTLAIELTGFVPGEALVVRLDDPDTGSVLPTQPAVADADGAAVLSATLPTAADGAHVLHAVGTTGTRAETGIRVDATPPTTADSTGDIGDAWRAQPVTVMLSPDDGPDGSGVVATHWTADGGDPTTQSAEGTAVPLSADGIHVVRYLSVDAAGNREAARTAPFAVRIDGTAPLPGTLATPGAAAVGGVLAIRNGQVLTAEAVDPVVNGASSGVAGVSYLACPGACTPTPGADGTFLIGSSALGPNHALAWTGQPADGPYSLRARVVDGAGSAADSAVERRIVDNDPPAIAATLADEEANLAGYVNRKDTFRAYANVVDAGVGVDEAGVTADLSAQCGSGCAAVPLSAAGGPFTVLTPTGTATYAYRSAVRTTSSGAGTRFAVRAADALGTTATLEGSTAIDTANQVPTPASVSLVNGATATGHATCPNTANGYLNAQHAAAATVHVVTGASAPANGVVVLTATRGSTTLRFARVSPQAGTRTIAFEGLDLRSLADGSVTLAAYELSPGGSATSATRSQAIVKRTATPTIAVGALLYADNASPTPDRASSTQPVGPAGGYLAFTQLAGSDVGRVFAAGPLGATGALTGVDLADERASPTYAVTAVDVACNASAAATWTPTATR